MISRITLSLLVVTLIGIATAQTANAPQPTPSPEQMAVYAAFIPEYTKGADFQMLVADQATALKPAQYARNACVKGIDFEPGQPEGNLQLLPPEFLKLGKIKFVEPRRQSTLIHKNDPSQLARDNAARGRPVTEKEMVDWSNKAYQNGMLTLSMVKFDTTKRFAIVEYTFECGEKCGHGGLMLFERVNGKWQKKKNCPIWIS